MVVFAIVAIISGDVIFDDNDNDLLEAGINRLHERCSLECIWVTQAESCSLSNTATTYVSTFIMQAEFNCVSYMLF